MNELLVTGLPIHADIRFRELEKNYPGYTGFEIHRVTAEGGQQWAEIRADKPPQNVTVAVKGVSSKGATEPEQTTEYLNDR